MSAFHLAIVSSVMQYLSSWWQISHGNVVQALEARGRCIDLDDDL
jgi:hypothetical protein